MTPISQRTLTQVQQIASEWYSGTLLIAQASKVLLDVGFGWVDKNSSQPIHSSTRFWIASITKQFTAAAILRLAESGLLAISDPLGRFFNSVPSDKAHIMLHQLLTHTAGLHQNYAADGITDRQAAVDAILSYPLAQMPGVCFGYSNDAYNLLAAVIEVVYGKSFESGLEKLILQPAGLQNTGFWGSAEHETVAEIYGEIEPAVRGANWGFRGAVGMFSTTGDLYRWHQALQSDAVLSSSSRYSMLGVQIRLDQNESAGYGWFQSFTPQGITTLWTRGTEGFGHNAIMLTIPGRQLVITAASNAGDIHRIALSRYLVELIVDRLTKN